MKDINLKVIYIDNNHYSLILPAGSPDRYRQLMKYRIEGELERISLHDYYMEDVEFDSDEIIIRLSGGYLENFKEAGIFEGIVFRKANLVFLEVDSQSFHTTNEIVMSKPLSFEDDYTLIGTNSITNDNGSNSFRIGLFNDESLENYYVEWIFNFKMGYLEWDKFITHAEWLAGKTN